MRKADFFIIIMVWGILWAAPSSIAQTGSGIEGEPEAAYGREADVSVVRVFGPDALTELTKEAIQEKRSDVAIETYYKPLKNKVWIEGTNGSGYMSLSPKRVHRLETARAKGGSVYSALCSQQKGVIKKTVGSGSDWVRIERTEVRTKRCVRTISRPAPVVVVPMVNFGFVVGASYPVYGYQGYGMYGADYHHYYRRWRGGRSFHNGYMAHHVSGHHHRGHR